MFDLITIGTGTRDIFWESPLFKVLRDPEHLKKIGFMSGEAECFALGSKIDVSKLFFTTGGGATNAATTFSRQGFKTGALIRIGKDESGGAIVAELKKEKVESFAVYDSKIGTGYATILIASNGERTVLVYRGASEGLIKKEIPFSKLQARWAYIAPGAIEVSVINNLVDFLHEKGVNIAINPSSKKFTEKKILGLKNILSKSKVVLLNREEASYLTGVDYNKEQTIFKKLDRAVPGIAVITDGGKGVSVSDGKKIYKAGVFPERKVVDRTGAGDAFGSGFVAGLMGQLTTNDLRLTTGDQPRSGAPKENKFPTGQASSLRGRRLTTLAPETIKYAIRLGAANATSVIEQVGAKKGILTKEEFEGAARFKNLPIEIKEL